MYGDGNSTHLVTRAVLKAQAAQRRGAAQAQTLSTGSAPWTAAPTRDANGIRTYFTVQNPMKVCAGGTKPKTTEV